VDDDSRFDFGPQEEATGTNTGAGRMPEDSIYEYKLRILNEDFVTCVVIEQAHLDAHSAIRSARKLAAGHPFEVWCGPDCIFGTPRSVPVTVEPHIPDHY
jgi:hypothetical protein